MRDDFFGDLQIRIIGDPDIDSHPYFFRNDGVIDDIPQHDLVIGNDDDDVVGGLNFGCPQPDINHIAPGGTAGRGTPDLNSIADLKRAVNDRPFFWCSVAGTYE